MGRKPVFSLAGLVLAGVTLTGCESTDWCCFGNNTTKKPAPDWRTVPQNPSPTPTGMNRSATQGEQSLVKPDPMTPSARESTGLAPQGGLPTGANSNLNNSEIAPPAPPSTDRSTTGTRPIEESTSSSGSPRSSAPRVDLAPLMDPPQAPLAPLPSTPPVPESPSSSFDVPPPPVPASPAKGGTTQSSSKYPSRSQEVALPPAPPGVPEVPGSNGN